VAAHNPATTLARQERKWQRRARTIEATAESAGRMVRGEPLQRGDASRFWSAVGRVARMSEQEKIRLMKMPKPAPQGSPERQALKWRMAGVDYDLIADRLEEDPTVVRMWVEQQLGRLAGEEVRSVEIARALHLERLEAIMAAHWEKSLRGSTDDSMMVLRVLERQAKLLGIDAPVKVDLTHRLRQVAVEHGIDPDEFIAEGMALAKAVAR
jgi:hypothetical protein